MELTEKLNLKKPDSTDYVNVNDLNDNMDILDQEVGDLKDDLTTHKAETASLIKIKKDVTIMASGWVDDSLVSGFWKYEILDADITADTVVDVNIHLGDLEKASSIKSANLSSNGKVTIYADEKPTANLTCDLKLIRQVS
ncbi:hypothetical protein [Anaerosalibacter sp. Marseille-P3206]|uniref:hypothetical protein n=1 Tax=Anaerosalibacter sp. Marseille-P3206 TaxID=1871005 RepID=UPI0009860E4D|nr:hypothetical protein [Anaerosalibacter sp. Marseille-P3206]